MSARTIMGIDPGATSAAWGALMEGRPKLATCDDVPVVDKMVDARSFARVLREIAPGRVVVERVGAMPKQGVSSSFRFGQGYGLILGVLASFDVEIVPVTPGVWKKFFRLDADKEKSRARAIELLPSAAVNLGRKKDAGRAEALLMALWLARQGATE